jgi:hypothetical protein
MKSEPQIAHMTQKVMFVCGLCAICGSIPLFSERDAESKEGRRDQTVISGFGVLLPYYSR